LPREYSSATELGIANSSGTLGHYLHDQFYVAGGVQAIVPEACDGKAPRGLMGGSGYMPRFRNLKGKEKDFIRGYAVDHFVHHYGGGAAALRESRADQQDCG
jgi:hypothetical protein